MSAENAGCIPNNLKEYVTLFFFKASLCLQTHHYHYGRLYIILDIFYMQYDKSGVYSWFDGLHYSKVMSYQNLLPILILAFTPLVFIFILLMITKQKSHFGNILSKYQ